MILVCCMQVLGSHTSLLPYSTTIIFFFFNHPPTTEIYTRSLHDALPIYETQLMSHRTDCCGHHSHCAKSPSQARWKACTAEEHTSELQSHSDLVCRLLLEKKKKNI